MSLLLNILWIAFGGLWMSIAWIVAAVIMATRSSACPGLGGDQWYLHALSVRPAAAARRVFRRRRHGHGLLALSAI
jgi:uncharacterized membrane protein YccF (DUF307 family)